MWYEQRHTNKSDLERLWGRLYCTAWINTLTILLYALGLTPLWGEKHSLCIDRSKETAVWASWGSERGSWRSGRTRWISSVQRPSLEGKERNGEFDRYFWQCVCMSEQWARKEIMCLFVYIASEVLWSLLTITPFFLELTHSLCLILTLPLSVHL